MAALPRQMDSPKHWQQWLGHSQNLVDLYAAQLRYDVAYRREWCERAGLGFELGELGYKLGAPILTTALVPALPIPTLTVVSRQLRAAGGRKEKGRNPGFRPCGLRNGCGGLQPSELSSAA